MDVKFTGSCHCGAVRYEGTAEPVVAGHCQCTDCQKFTGTGHSSHIAVRKSAVSLSGTAKIYEVRADSGNTVGRAFCPECGSPVYSLNSGAPELIFLRPSGLDDPSLFKPTRVLFTDSGQPWDYMDPALSGFPRGSRG